MNILEVCGTGNSAPKNTGTDKECLEEGMIAYWVTKEDFRYPDLATAKTKAALDTAKANKDVVPMFNIDEAPEDTTTEPEYKEGLTRKVKTKDAVKGIKVTHWLGLCSHSSLKSYENSEYTRVFPVLNDGKVRGTVFPDGQIGGLSLSDFIVETRRDAIVGSDVPRTVVELKFDDLDEHEKNYAIFQPEYNAKQVKGIFDVSLSADAVSANTVEIAATLGCGGTSVKSLALADFVLTDASGTAKTIDSAPYNASTDKYVLTGASIVATDILTLNGVVQQSINMYEAIEPVTLQ